MQLDAISQATAQVQGHVVICGYGRVGQSIGRFLRLEQQEFIALDDDPIRVQEATAGEDHVHYGDSSRTDLLLAVGMLRARLPAGVRLLALTSSAERIPELRAQGITPLPGNLDNMTSLKRLAGIASRVLHLAPPANTSPTERRDTRTQNLLRALSLRSLPLSVVYGSTSGVYGDCAGEWIDETRPVRPATARGWRRVSAENALRHFGRAMATPVHILRIPGIYAADREGGTPRARLLKGTPVLQQADDVYTNHIHAEDLARATGRCPEPARLGNGSRPANLWR